MSTAIDQILQIAAPARPVTEPARATTSDGPAFQNHLERAANEVVPPRNSEQAKEDNADLSSATVEQDTGASQYDEGPASTEFEEKTDNETEIEAEGTVATETDEVSVSETAAAALADLLAEAENEDLETELLAEPPAEETDSDSEELLSTPIAQPSDPALEDDQSKQPAALLEAEVGATPSTQSEKKKGAAEKLPGDTVGDLKLSASGEGETRSEIEPATATQTTPSSAVKQSDSEKGTEQQPLLVKTETESNESHSKDSKSERTESKAASEPSAAFTEKQAVLNEASELAPENRPSVAASAPAGETSANATPQQATPNGVVANLASQTSGNEPIATSEAHAEPEGTSTVDRARFVRRVGGAIRSAQSRDGKIQLQLRPSELGTLRIEMTVKEGVVTARLEAETSAARTILLDNLPALRERLAEQEIRIDKFDVDVRDEGRPTSDNPGAEDRNANSPQRESQAPGQKNGRQQETERTSSAAKIHSVQVDSLDVSV